MVIKPHTQMFDIPHDRLSLSTDLALPCYPPDDKELLASSDTHRNLYLIAQ